MRGRKPTPDHLKIVRGNPGKRRLRVSAPVEPGMPDMPIGMSAKAAELWPVVGKQLVDKGVLSPEDGLALQSLCEAYADVMWARQDMETNGRTQEVETTSGSIKEVARPCVAMLAEAERRLHRGLTAFGIAGAESRIRVKHTPRKQKQRPGEEYFGT